MQAIRSWFQSRALKSLDRAKARKVAEHLALHGNGSEKQLVAQMSEHDDPIIAGYALLVSLDLASSIIEKPVKLLQMPELQAQQASTIAIRVLQYGACSPSGVLCLALRIAGELRLETAIQLICQILNGGEQELFCVQALEQIGTNDALDCIRFWFVKAIAANRPYVGCIRTALRAVLHSGHPECVVENQKYLDFKNSTLLADFAELGCTQLSTLLVERLVEVGKKHTEKFPYEGTESEDWLKEVVNAITSIYQRNPTTVPYSDLTAIYGLPMVKVVRTPRTDNNEGLSEEPSRRKTYSCSPFSYSPDYDGYYDFSALKKIADHIRCGDPLPFV